ncbi:UNVERIFIED_CONTAM: hypothetical protein K2H54_061210 [Gekko kuhli]
MGFAAVGRQQPREARPGQQHPPPPFLREKEDENSTVTATAHEVRCCQQAAAEGSPARAAAPSSLRRRRTRVAWRRWPMGFAAVSRQQPREARPGQQRPPPPFLREKEDKSSTATAHGVRCCKQAAAEGSPARAAAPSLREKEDKSSTVAVAHGVSPIRYRQQLKDAWPGRRRRPLPGHLKPLQRLPQPLQMSVRRARAESPSGGLRGTIR